MKWIALGIAILFIIGLATFILGLVFAPYYDEDVSD